jgi:hypothetical protein
MYGISLRERRSPSWPSNEPSQSTQQMKAIGQDSSRYLEDHAEIHGVLGVHWSRLSRGEITQTYHLQVNKKPGRFPCRAGSIFRSYCSNGSHPG